MEERPGLADYIGNAFQLALADAQAARRFPIDYSGRAKWLRLQTAAHLDDTFKDHPDLPTVPLLLHGRGDIVRRQVLPSEHAEAYSDAAFADIELITTAAINTMDAHLGPSAIDYQAILQRSGSVLLRPARLTNQLLGILTDNLVEPNPNTMASIFGKQVATQGLMRVVTARSGQTKVRWQPGVESYVRNCTESYRGCPAAKQIVSADKQKSTLLHAFWNGYVEIVYK